MFTSVSVAIKQLFSAVTIMFMALEKSAKALDNLAGVAEATSAAYADEAVITRAKRRHQLEAELKVVEQAPLAQITQQ